MNLFLAYASLSIACDGENGVEIYSVRISVEEIKLKVKYSHFSLATIECNKPIVSFFPPLETSVHLGNEMHF